MMRLHVLEGELELWVTILWKERGEPGAGKGGWETRVMEGEQEFSREEGNTEL